MNQYHLISTAVVDEDERIVGVITIDDVIVVLDEENQLDILSIAGVGDGRLSDTLQQTTQQCVPWFTVNFVTANLASFVVTQIEAKIESFVAHVVLTPIIALMGGNAGMQSLTVTMRALASKCLTSSVVRRLVWREVFVGLINDTFFALTEGALVLIWLNSSTTGYVTALAMVINFIITALPGIGVPIN